MPICLKKLGHDAPIIVPDGTAVRLSITGTVLFVLNEHGTRIRRFNAKSVTEYWVEEDSRRIVPGEMASKVANVPAPFQA
jgi:hypothetical protein